VESIKINMISWMLSICIDWRIRRRLKGVSRIRGIGRKKEGIIMKRSSGSLSIGTRRSTSSCKNKSWRSIIMLTMIIVNRTIKRLNLGSRNISTIM